nr:NAD-dependent epimerase/dehydratase family protein [uncultured Roseateles sp.]
MSAIAILGASSQIARDLLLARAPERREEWLLYVRDVAATQRWLAQQGLRAEVMGHERYGDAPHDAVLNFVGVGDPQRAQAMGGEIFQITQHFDDLVLAQLKLHPQRRYIFMSSGAAYGSGFAEPAGPQTRASIALNALTPQDFYAVAKLHAEAKHRALPGLAITDIRVFNYFSRSQDLAARFFITDILRAVRDGRVLQASAATMVRDFLHPQDFHQLVQCILRAPAMNGALDAYSRAPVDKPTLLAAMQQCFGLQYEFTAADAATVNATGAKPFYYSLNRQAADLGYQPAYASLDAIIEEAGAILGRAPMTTTMGETR